MDPDTLMKSLKNLASSSSTSSKSKESSDAAQAPSMDTTKKIQDKDKGDTRTHQSEPGSKSSPKNPQVVFTWEAPIRAYKKKPAGVMRFYFAIAFLLSLIAIFFREYVVVVPIWAIMFLVYVLTITEPPVILHTITRFGLQTGTRTHMWDDLSHFYFIEKFSYHVLVVYPRNQNEAPLYLVVPGDEIRDLVLDELSHHLVFVERPQKTLTDKFAEWLTTLMPEESEEDSDTAQKKALK